MTTHLRWLYERYRTASAANLHMETRKPGEWLEVTPGSPEAAAILGAAPEPGLDGPQTLKRLAGEMLNARVGVTCDHEVRITSFRNGTSKSFYVRFFLALPGKKRGPRVDRKQLPAATSAQTELGLETGDAQRHTSVSSRVGVRLAEGDDGRPLISVENSQVSDDWLIQSIMSPGTAPAGSVPDLSELMDLANFEHAKEVTTERYDELADENGWDPLEEILSFEESLNMDDLMKAVGSKLAVAQSMSPIVDVAIQEPQDWHTVSRQVGEATRQIVEKYRPQKGKMALLCPSPGTGKPLHEDTLVTMFDGSRRPIKNLVVGDRVISGRGRVTEVLAVYDQGPLEVLKITTRSGRKVVAEGTHRFLTQRGWVEAKDLRSHDTRGSGARKGPNGEPYGRGDVLQVRYGMSRQTVPMSASAARFLGYMTGDGGCTQPTGLKFSNIDSHVLAKFSSCCTDLGMRLRQVNKADWAILYADPLPEMTSAEKVARRKAQQKVSAAAYRRRKIAGDGPRKKAVHHPGRLLLLKHGMLGIKSAQKRVPTAIFAANNDAIAEFIGAYFECDGTRQEGKESALFESGKRPPTASFSSVSMALLQEVQSLLGRLGIRTSLRLKNGRYKGKPHVSWRLSVLDLHRFFADIPMVGAKSGSSFASRRREPVDGQAKDPVMSVEPTGQARCLCITVADDESFVANDFVTHNTHVMLQAACDEQRAGRRVGYAVLARALLAETKERIEKTSPTVKLHVIEGRHAGNCSEFDSVESAQSNGYAPGSEVCPRCEKYPPFPKTLKGGGKNRGKIYKALSEGRLCGYYAARVRAVKDVERAEALKNAAYAPYPVILTTHAGLVIGTGMSDRANQEFWKFDTVFIDEDPANAIETATLIGEPQLVYECVDPETKRADAHTRATRIFRRAFEIATQERKASHMHGYIDPASSLPSTIHSRDYGSDYAGNDFLALLWRAATSLGYMLSSTLAQVENESNSKKPKRGELLGLKEETVSRRFPHRSLAVICKAIYIEMETRREATEKGLHGLDLAYRVHLKLDLDKEASKPGTAGITHGFVCLRQAVPFGAREANVVCGDAYGNVADYEHLFQRWRRYGDVDVVNYRAKWPKSSVLIRIAARSRASDLAAKSTFIDHCNWHVRSILGLETGRKVLFYVHSGLKLWLEEWLDEQALVATLDGHAIDYWGSGRGKDIYRDFDTFIAVSEYVPNVGGLIHEANARVLPTDRLAPRIRFNHQKGVSFSNSIEETHPALVGAFQRKSVDELAQAVHRIRPAMSVDGAKPKRCWILGFHVPLSNELLAATSASVIRDQSNERIITEMGFDPEQDRDRAKRFQADLGVLSFVSRREAASAMGEVYRALGCWSPIFAHVLLAVPECSDLSQVLPGAGAESTAQLPREAIVEEGSYDSAREFAAPGAGSGDPVSRVADSRVSSSRLVGRLVDRVLSPPPNARATADRIQTHLLYRDALALFESSLPSKLNRGTVVRDWMPLHGRVSYLGNTVRMERIIDGYEPGAKPLQF